VGEACRNSKFKFKTKEQYLESSSSPKADELQKEAEQNRYVTGVWNIRGFFKTRRRVTKQKFNIPH
jgi:hypothetical protein